MHLLKRLGIFCLDVSLLILSLILTLFVSAGIEYLWRPLAWPTFVLAFFASILLYFWRRKKLHKSQIEYDATRFLAARRAATLHPRRAKCLRLARRVLLCLPSASALFVLLFFPQATHIFHVRSWGPLGAGLLSFVPPPSQLFHPGPDHVIRNHVHIPWNSTILYTFDSPTSRFSSVSTICYCQSSWPFGPKLFWDKTARLSSMSFGSVTAAELLERISDREKWPHSDESTRSSLEFNSHGVTLTCRRYLALWNRVNWYIDCEPTSPLQPYNFTAYFFGPADDVPAFYQVIQNSQPAN